MTTRKDYPVGYIRKLLAHYDELSASPKAVIDKAMDSLDDIEKEVVTKLHIEGYPLADLEKKFDNLWQIERQAVGNMTACLNGECILERWCKENGMVSHGNIRTPDYLPYEIQQFVRDICLKYCVLGECPN